MLPSQFRLKLPPVWNRNSPDHKVSTLFFKVIAKEVAGYDNPRVGFIISAKVGKAVVRNRLRRKLEQNLLPLLEKSKRSLQIIIILYPSCAGASYEDLNTNLNQALSKIRL